MPTSRTTITFILLTVLTAALLVADVVTGSVNLSVGEVWAALSGGDCAEQTRRIVLDIRLVKALTAFMVGVALSVSGLQMQTVFHNPLAGPYVLGISSGASLGVALFILAAPFLGGADWIGGFGLTGMAWLGAGAVLLLIAVLYRRIRDIMVLLILGIMLSSAIGAVVQILQYVSNEESLKAYVVWTMGNLGDVTWQRMAVMMPAVVVGLILAVVTVKALNLMLLGDDYARTMGLNIRRSRALIFISTAMLAGTVTAFCGPIGFIGLAVPHVARFLTDSADHRVLLPASALTGAAVMVGCDIISRVAAVPVNAITALLGIPVVVWIVFKFR